MAYYHRKVALNRFEQFELSADLKKTSGTKAVAEKQRPKEYGSGIAAQFGLIKKPAAVKCRKNTEDIPLKKKKRIAPEDEDNSNTKLSRKLSNTDGKKCRSRDKSISPEHSHHGKRKKLKEDTKLCKTSTKSLPREVNLGLINQDIDDDSDSHESRIVAKNKLNNRDKKNINKHGKHLDIERLNKNRNKYTDDDISESSEDDTLKSAQYNRTNSKENSVRNKSIKSSEVTKQEKVKKKSRIQDDDDDDDDDDGEAYRNDNFKGSNVASASKKNSEPTKVKKQKAFTIPKHSKASTSDQLVSPSGNSTKSNDKPNERDKNMNHRLKEQIIRRHSNESNDSESPHRRTSSSNDSLRRTNSCNETVDIKTESTEEDIEMPHNIPQEFTNIRNKSRLKTSSHSPGHIIKNIKPSSNLGSLPSKSSVDNHQGKSTLKSNFVKNNMRSIDIKSEPDDDEDTEDTDVANAISDNYKNDHRHSKQSENNESRDSSSTNKCTNSLTEKFAGREKKKQETVTKINLGNGQYFINSAKEIYSSKGEALSDWFKVVNDNLKEKSTKTDNSVLNYFITLHSRFKVMESMEMNDLEVLPEEEGDKGVESEPIRIFTNLSKDHYKQYLDESCLNSIPELIITRLYPVTS